MDFVLRSIKSHVGLESVKKNVLQANMEFLIHKKQII